jgi:hypothetical protein
MTSTTTGRKNVKLHHFRHDKNQNGENLITIFAISTNNGNMAKIVIILAILIGEMAKIVNHFRENKIDNQFFISLSLSLRAGNGDQ